MDEEIRSDIKVKLREEQDKLTKLIVAIDELEKTPDYQKVKELLFDGLVQKLENQIKQEALTHIIDPNNLYRLQGELSWAKRYANLQGYASSLKIKLEAVKKRLQ